MNKNKILLFLLTLLCAQSCTYEDLRNCPQGLYVSFEAVNEKISYVDVVEKVDLFLYGMNGNLAEKYTYHKSDLRVLDGAAYIPNPPEGSYYMVAVINSGQDMETKDIEQYVTLRSELKQDELTYRPVDFMTGMKQITVARSDVKIQSESVELVKHNNDIRLKVVYDGYDFSDNTQITAYIIGNNGAFAYRDYHCPQPCQVIYRPFNILYGDNGLPEEFDITTMRLWHGGDVSIELVEYDNTRAVSIISLNIADALSKVCDDDGEFLYDTDEKLEQHNEYEITVRIGKEFVVLGVTVGDWDTTGGGIEV